MWTDSSDEQIAFGELQKMSVYKLFISSFISFLGLQLNEFLQSEISSLALL